MPPEVESLIYVVRIRHLGEKLGFEKVIVKNGIMIAFFIYNPMSPYYREETFSRILKRVSEMDNKFELKNTDQKLRIISRNINTMADAYSILQKL